ncbi:uncharacterized protein LOC119385242 [Rhipicephalus sanguineus]|uniref:uncharacterized protein LOC119385242 n=1 Tax=Rhipicephalus sanguineus TaxID=34632 RepID=UPI0018946ECA|nr:uncharacterized protein LOC119385242 [Rhipicephalus sanguineus]
MNLDDRDRLTEFSRNFSESSVYASYVTAWNRVVLCYEGSASDQQGRSWSMDRQLTAIRNFFRRLFFRNKEVAAAAGQNAEHAESAADVVANHENAASKHDEQLGDHKDPSDDYHNQVARPAQLKSPFTHSTKCGHF